MLGRGGIIRTEVIVSMVLGRVGLPCIAILSTCLLYLAKT